MFREVQHKKVSLEIISQIREAILNGSLNPGDRLPPEKKLVASFGVSKHTLREAIRALEAMGFLEVRKGASGGAVVLEVDMKTTRQSIADFLYFQNVSIQHLSEVRKVFEPYLARMAAERMSSDELSELETAHRASMSNLVTGSIAYEQEIGFHQILARVSGNPAFVLIDDFVSNVLGESKRRLRPGLRFQQEVVEAHDRILAAVRSRDPELAEAEMLRHVCEVERALEDLERQGDQELREGRRKLESLVEDIPYRPGIEEMS